MNYETASSINILYGTYLYEFDPYYVVAYPYYFVVYSFGCGLGRKT